MKMNVRLIIVMILVAVMVSHGEVRSTAIANHNKSEGGSKFHPQAVDNWLGIHDSDGLILLFDRFDWDAKSWLCKTLLKLARPTNEWDGRMSIYQTSDMNFIVMKYQKRPKKGANIWIVYHLNISEEVISETMKGF